MAHPVGMLMNSLNRWIPKGYKPFQGAFNLIKDQKRVLIPVVISKNEDKKIESISHIFDRIPIQDGMTLSFHHHLRNGDGVTFS